MYEYILKGKTPSWPDRWQSLVQHGLAQFADEAEKHDLKTNPPPAQIKEPLALVSITRYLESHEYSIDDHVRDVWRRALDDSGKGLGFENAVILAITRLLRDGKTTLQDVFRFYGEIPSWAHSTAQIVAQISAGDFQPFNNITDRPVLPSSSVAFFAKDLQAVHECPAPRSGPTIARVGHP